MRITALMGIARIATGFVISPGLIRTYVGMADALSLVILVIACFAPVAEVLRFAIIEAIFFGASVDVVLVYGTSPGVAVMLTLFILVATISYDMKGGIIAGALSLLLVLAGAWGWTSGRLPVGAGIAQVPPSHFEYWLRAIFAQCLSVFGITWIVSHITREMRNVISQLRHAEEKFSKSFRISPDAIIISEFDSGRIIEVNDSHERLTGFSRKDVVGRTSVEIGTFKDMEDRDAFLAPVRAAGSARRVERQIHDSKGRAIDIVYSAERFELAGKRCLVTTIQDISEQKKTEAALIANEERFRSFVENASVGIYRSTPDGKIVMANPTLVRIMGYDSFEQLSERNLEKEGYEPSYPRSQFKAAIETSGVVDGLETAWKKRDGSTIFVRESASVIRTADGRVQYYDGIIEDITARKVAEQALRESEERFRNLTAAAFEGVVITEEGRILDINDQGLRLFGYERHEMIGKNVEEFVSPETRQLVSEAILNRREVTYKHLLVRKDGTRFHAEAQAKMTHLGDRVLRMTALRDITEQLQAEQRQKNLEEQLRQMQKMEALGTLAGGIAHDFNNILTGILANLQLAEMDLASSHPAHESVKAANQASIRARDLVARILAFTRLEKENRAAASLGPIVLEAVQLLRVGLPGNIEVRSEIDAACPYVTFDPGQIHQVVMNLGTNSIHAMSSRGGTLSVDLRSVRPGPSLIETHPQVSASHTVCLTLRDTGCGMDKAVMKRIFEPFYTTKMFGQGTGLGLAMVHAIMKSHNGAIIVESSPGVGTTFELYFLPSAVQHGRPGPAAGESGAGGLSPFGNARKIMLVDDEETVRSIGGNLLKRFGFVAVVFGRPAEALEAFRAAPADYCAVVSDLTMPEMTGLELARHMLAIRAETPIILTSGYFHSEAQQKAREAGVRSVINKPFEVFELIEQIRAALEAPASRET